MKEEGDQKIDCYLVSIYMSSRSILNGFDICYRVVHGQKLLSSLYDNKMNRLRSVSFYSFSMLFIGQSKCKTFYANTNKRR